MNINDVTKFVINLDRRVDRLNSIQEEMGYIGWNFERFSAVDTNSHRGCSLSHIEIIKIAKSHNLKEVLVIEDDCTFMPYSKSLIQTIVEETNNLDFGIFNLAPTLNRPVNLSQDYTSLLDITNLPPAESHHRGIFATNMIMYDESVYDEVLALEESSKLNYYAIDDFIYQFILPKHASFCPVLPIGPQISDWSDVSHGQYNNFYVQTYNWNLYSPVKIPNNFSNLSEIQKIKKENIHLPFNL
jgi:hypothetical protein